MLASGGIQAAKGAQRRVAPFLLLALASLLMGLWAGLARIGWNLPDADSQVMLRHGGLMVVGFVATVIAIERAVAVHSLVAFAAPALSAAAGLALIAGAPAWVAPALAASSGLAFSLNVAFLVYEHRELAMELSLAGGVCLAIAGVVWWDGGSIRDVVPWWIAFLALTILAERLEIIRFQRFTAHAAAFGAAILALLLAGPAVTLFDLDAGIRVLGAGLLLAPIWLVRRDIASRTVRADGLARFAAAGVLTAYAWLAVSGALILAWGLQVDLRYDAVIHAFFIGFVFTAIIAHEPIIAPAITGFAFKYTPLLYVPLASLDGSLVARIAADLGEWNDVRRWAGMVQALAITLFLLLSAASVATSRAGPASLKNRAARLFSSRGSGTRPGTSD